MFKPAGGLRGGDSACIKTVIIDNSDALRAFDAVKLLNGDLEALAAGNSVFGVIIAIVDKHGNALSPETVTLNEKGSATISTSVTPPAVTVASDNETVDQVAARVDLSLESIFSGDIEAAETVNTTVSSAKPGTYIDVADQRTLDETTATRTLATGGQFYGWGQDPMDSSNILCSIHESEFYGFGKVIG